MGLYNQRVEVRWSDLDPNFHVRHSVYYDYGAFCRIAYLAEHGLGTDKMAQHQIGPILFREECVFRREIRYGDQLSIDLQLLKSSEDISRWSIRHRILKEGNVLAAIITVDGAWMDIKARKLTVPPEIVQQVFGDMHRDPDFEWIIRP